MVIQMKSIYLFSEGSKDMKGLLGGKGANLAEMTKLGVPVPPGFTITTEVCDYYNKNGRYPNTLEGELNTALSTLEKQMGMKLGDPENPLLVSVRSGAAISMPGMMDTILNLGLNDTTVEAVIRRTSNPRFAWDSYRRFIQMFGDVVMGVPHSKFEAILHEAKETKGVSYDIELDADDLRELTASFKEIIEREAGREFPAEPREQLRMAIDAVFGSWNNERAILYRKLNNITGLKGTAVNVQAMVFGNMGNDSGTGVCFTRNPSTGENAFYGEYLMNAQGEDVVAGIRTPQPISSLEKQLPGAYKQLLDIRERLEKHYRDMQDMEFTIQKGKLYMLQTRTGKRTAAAAVRIAVEMVDEGLITKDEALLRIDPLQLDQLLHPQLDPIAKAEAKVAAAGLPASPGAAVGEAVFDAQKAHEMVERDKAKVVLVRTETSPEDLIGMNAAEGILTARGGMTSHAAVVARGMGKCCIAGCQDITIKEDEGYMVLGGQRVEEGDVISLDGTEGKVYIGAIPTVEPGISGYFGKLMGWADEARKLGVRTNADTPHDAKVARKFGAEGIGLCRTEHMFFEGDRINIMREMILAPDRPSRKRALDKLLPMQQEDFKGLFDAMEGLPVTIRLLDPPLHEFLPHEEADIKEVASQLGVSVSALREKMESLREVNPMLGHRGVRLAITYPEIAEMQAEAIIRAALDVKKEGKEIVPEIMIPLVGDVKELAYVKKVVCRVADELIGEAGVKMRYMVGTMIEVPRAALTAGEIASEAEFFSFGTNDLTQMTLGFSRDDAGKFLPEYLSKRILDKDPFQALDQEGVGQLVKMAVEKGRKARPGIHLGICGEHGGEPSSIEFCHKAGLDYVSCSPYRVPIARLAAAQAALRAKASQ